MRDRNDQLLKVGDKLLCVKPYEEGDVYLKKGGLYEYVSPSEFDDDNIVVKGDGAGPNSIGQWNRVRFIKVGVMKEHRLNSDYRRIIL